MKVKKCIYEKYVKRCLDVICAVLALICFFWLYILLGVLVRIKLGTPVLFKQPRPGRIDETTGVERIFYLYKFRTMTNETDENGILLPDEKRLTKFGALLRASSLDELPEVVNILKGEMSIVGPRPQLVRDLVFMSKEHRRRHIVRPGLTGLAQVSGRNAISWEDKLDTDLRYISKISFMKDLNIVMRTVINVFVLRKDITDGEHVTAEDYGDYLLRKGKISQEEYGVLQKEAQVLLARGVNNG